MYELNDKVVYPGHGVAIISETIEKTVAGTKIKFFKLNFLYKDMSILAPIYNLNNTGIRPPSSKKEVEEAINELYKVPEKKINHMDFTPSGWNRRNKEYQLKIQSGKLLEIAQIYRDLMYVSLQKELSFGEKNLLQTAEELIVQEIQLVISKEREVILQNLQAPFKQFFFQEVAHGQALSSSVI